ncbi:MAG: tetratricopeptide repeat protein [Elusimicrobiota bacterium]|nr:tetratricopeptide repeat protein [Elusimicrobiota bacterium]
MSAALLLLLPFCAPSAASVRDAAAARFEKADAHLEKGRYEQARAELAAVKLAPDDPRQVRRWEREGAVRLREGKIAEARAAFTQALKAAGRLEVKGPDAGRAYAGMGLVLLRQEKPGLAARFFKRGLDFEPDEGTRLFLEEQIAELEAAGRPR